MTRIDRYLLTTFLRIFLIAQISLTGMFVVIHLFTNLDELTDQTTATRSLFQVVAGFYGPRVLDFFDRSLAILLLVAGVFTLAMMQRRQEMTAVEAAGIPRLRLLRPVLVGAVGLTCLAVANRELLIPRYRETLVSTAQNWKNPDAKSSANLHKDHVWGYLVSTCAVDSHSGEVSKPVVQLPVHLSRRIPRIAGTAAQWQPASEQHAAGLLLTLDSEAPPLPPSPDLKAGDLTAIHFAANNPWLKPNQVFVVSSLGLDELAYGRQLTDYTSLPDMIATLRRPSQWYSQANRIAVHARIVRPLLDLSLVLVGLPLILGWTDRNLFVAALVGVGIAGLFSLVVVGSQLLGNYSLIRPAALSAWLPVMVFLPLAIPASRLMLR